MARYLRLAAALILAAGLASVLATQLRLTTDMSRMMPEGQGRREASVARAIATSRLSRTMIVSLGASSDEKAVLAAKVFREGLEADPRIEGEVGSISGGPPADIETALWQVYAPRRLGFAARSPEQAERLVSQEGLRAALVQLKEELLSPLSALVTRTAPQDPFLSLPRLFSGLEAQAPEGLRVVDEQYVAAGHHAIVFVELSGSSFDATVAERAVQAVDRASATAARAVPGLDVESSGLARFSLRARDAIRTDVQRVSVVSTAAIVLLCLLLFRSLRMVLLSALPIGLGMAAGLVALTWGVGVVHGITLAFGASLIGVCIDAVVHFYAHYLQSEREAPRAVMKRIAPAMALGALTTLVGFCVLSFSAFPGLSQAAILGAVGVSVAYLATVLLLPDLVPQQRTTPPAFRALGAALLSFQSALARRRELVLGAALVLCLACLAGWSRVHYEDDMRQMVSFDPELKAEEERVRARVAKFDTSRFVVAAGPTDEAALLANERAFSVLQQAREAGEVEAIQSVASLLPSAETQRRVQASLRAAGLGRRLPPLLEAAGFSAAAFAPFFAQLKETPSTPVTYAELADTPLAALVAPHRIQLEGEVLWLTYLRGVKNAEALSSRLAPIEGAFFLDQTQVLSQIDHRPARMALLLGVGLLCVVGFLLLRFRRPVRALAAVLPAILATGCTVGLVSWMGQSLNLVSVSALLMVLSMGADYGVFVVDAACRHEKNEAMAATLSALCVAALSTVLSFSVLAVSEQQVLRSIGLIASLGVALSFVFAQLGALLVRDVG